MLCMAPCLAPLTSTRHTFFYHQDGSASRILIAALLNVIWPWLLFVILFFIAERSNRARFLIWTTFLSLLPWALLRSYAVFSGWQLSFLMSRIVLGTSLTLLFGYMLARRRLAIHLPQLQNTATVILIFFSISWLPTLCQLAYYATQTRHLNTARPMATARPNSHLLATTSHPRIVWILLDELAFDQVFEHRLPNLQLNAFDQLSRESTIFSQASSPGLYTEQVVPQLFNGHRASQVRFALQGQLFYLGSRGNWHQFQPEDSVFNDAVQIGYKTAIAGWHNPYCRILDSVLDRCYWISRTDSVTPEFDGDASFSANLLGPVRRLFQVLRHFPSGRDVEREDNERYAALHIEDVKSLFRATDTLLADPSVDFVFLHIPIPHPGGIFDRKRSRFTNTGESSIRR